MSLLKKVLLSDDHSTRIAIIGLVLFVDKLREKDTTTTHSHRNLHHQHS